MLGTIAPKKKGRKQKEHQNQQTSARMGYVFEHLDKTIGKAALENIESKNSVLLCLLFLTKENIFHLKQATERNCGKIS
jgi:hypothetical protein